MKKSIIAFLKLILIFSIISCDTNENNSENIYLFIRNTPQFPYKDVDNIIEINNNCIFFSEDPNLGNSFKYRRLTTNEGNQIKKIISGTNIDNKYNEYISNPAGANFDFYIYIKYKNNWSKVYIYDDTIPYKYKQLIMLIDNIKKDRSYDTIISKINGINYAKLVLENKDTYNNRYWKAYNLWKYLMLYKGKQINVDTIKTVNTMNYYSVLYGLNYNATRINHVIVLDSLIFLFYNNNKIIRLDGKEFIEK